MNQTIRPRRGRRVILILLAILLFFAAANCFLNRNLWVTSYTISSSRLPEAFDGCRIIQLTDLHSLRQGVFLEKLLAAVRQEKPDLLLITGDLVDSKRYMAEKNDLLAGKTGDQPGGDSLELLRLLLELAPVYYVYGNHEMVLLDNPERNPFKTALEEMGVHLLNVQEAFVEKDGQRVRLWGLQDPSTLYKDSRFAGLEGGGAKTEAMLDLLTASARSEDADPAAGASPGGLEDTGPFTLLLAHRPEYLDIYGRYPVDLVFSGHAHGGQFRLPFAGGLYAPNQGFFPKYDAGLYSAGGCRMILSRGIGNSVIPVRLFNPPEVVRVTLRTEK